MGFINEYLSFSFFLPQLVQIIGHPLTKRRKAGAFFRHDEKGVLLVGSSLSPTAPRLLKFYFCSETLCCQSNTKKSLLQSSNEPDSVHLLPMLTVTLDGDILLCVPCCAWDPPASGGRGLWWRCEWDTDVLWLSDSLTCVPQNNFENR